MNEHSKYLLVILGAVVCLGLVPITEKLALEEGASLLSVVFWVNLVTVAVLFVPGWSQKPDQFLQQWQDIILIGVIASGVVVYLNFWALQTTSSTHRSVFQAMYPAATALFAYFIVNELLSWRGYAVITAMILGSILMSIDGFRWQMAPGNLILFTTLPLMGFSDAWVKKSLSGLSPAWVALGRFAIGTLLLAIAFVFSGQAPMLLSNLSWHWILLSGFLIGIGILLLYHAIELKGASVAAAMMSLAPVITLSVEWLFLEQRFTAQEFVGIGIVLLGAVVLTSPGIRARRESS